MSGVRVRAAASADCKGVMDLIKPSNNRSLWTPIAITMCTQELAVYEKMPEQVRIDPKVLERDGFGEKKFFECFVAEQQDGTRPGRIVGYALYFYTYSTWEGRMIYLEDLYVTPEYRGQGVGTQLWNSVVRIGLENECQRLQFCVLNWNLPSIEFYKKRGAFDVTEKEKFHIYRINRPELEAILQK